MMNVGGIYTDPFHAPITASANIFQVDAPWFGGIRILGRDTKDGPGKFLCIGCDDGFHFWVLTASFADETTGSVDMDFTPKAPGVGMLKCSYAPGALSFLEDDGKTVGNTWSRLRPTAGFDLTRETRFAAFNQFNGLYIDPDLYKPGSFAGIRVMSDRLGKIIRDELCVIGTDDGVEWWSIEGGSFTEKEAGSFCVGKLTGTCHNGVIQFEDGKEWIKMAAKSDLHSLPKDDA